MKYKKIIDLILVLIVLILLARIASLLAAESTDSKLERDKGIIKGAEPISIYKNSTKSVLLLHGFAANTYSMKELADFFSENDYNVYAPLLPGHGTSAFDMEKYSWRDWQNKSEESYLMLRNTSKDVYVVGVSMGADLGLNLAKKYDINGLIIINAPYNLKTNIIYAAPVVYFTQKYFIKNIFLADDDMTLSEEYRIYSIIPVKSVYDILDLIHYTDTDLDKVNETILIIRSDKDSLVDPSSADIIYSLIKSNDKKLIRLENSTHIYFTDQDKFKIQKEILNIIK